MAAMHDVSQQSAAAAASRGRPAAIRILPDRLLNAKGFSLTLCVDPYREVLRVDRPLLWRIMILGT
jgi:hypothetical protein